MPGGAVLGLSARRGAGASSCLEMEEVGLDEGRACLVRLRGGGEKEDELGSDKGSLTFSRVPPYLPPSLLPTYLQTSKAIHRYDPLPSPARLPATASTPPAARRVATTAGAVVGGTDILPKA